MANDAVPYFDPGDTFTAYCEAAVSGKRFVSISGPRVDGLPQISPTGAGAAAVGVASRDAALGGKVMVARVGIWPVVAGGAITAGDPIKADAAGEAIPQGGAGEILGYALDDAADGADVPVALRL
jgi:hypothetical protein